MMLKNNTLLDYESKQGVMFLFDDNIGSHISITDKVFQFVFNYLSVYELNHISRTCHALNNAVYKYVLINASKRFACEVLKNKDILDKTRSNSYAWDSVIHFTDSTRLLIAVMSGKVGKNYQLEIEVRRRFRGFFIDQLTESESKQGFWLSALLRTQKSVAEQGRLFMLLFGPIKYVRGQERIDWYLMSKKIFTRNQCAQIIKPLSSNLYCLSKTRELKSMFSWSDSEIFTLIEEITSMCQ
ncbi:unnamed protein product [Acanthocheilonema viteae]|uniref:FBXO47 ARM repeats region domain-containing protein n=1 Tax=Acanthocheilonema viteae TaxID=6277 RepID=A0A498SG00_ACAVI|nr:unnamed protein product [Acanthocheilonema viteae]